MNFKTVWHLFTADAQRLRWLIIAVLVLLLFGAGQYFFSDPWSLPADTTSSSTSLPEYLRRRNHEWVPFFSPLAAVFAVTLGWHGATAARLRPVRRREIALSKFASLLVFLYVPQMLAILLVLTRHGIPFNQAALGMAAAAGAFVPLWIILAAYGRLAGTMWRFLGAAGATIAVLGMLTVAFKNFERGPLDTLAVVCNDGWGRNAGPLAWSVLWSSAFLMLVLTAFTIRRWKPFWRCAVAAMGVLAISFAMRDVDLFTLKPSAAAKELVTQEVLDGIQLVMPDEIQLQENRQPKLHTLRVSGGVDTKGLPPGVFCTWKTESARLYDDGRLIPEPPDSIPNRRSGQSRFYPSFGFNELSQAIQRAFPENELLRKEPDSDFLIRFRYPAPDSNWQHAFVFSPTESFQTETQFSMELEMTGTLYRYEIIANVPINQEPTVSCLGGRLQVKVMPEAKPMGKFEALAISFQGPVSGVAEHVSALHHTTDLQNLWKPVLYLPESGEIIPRSSHPYHAKGPLLSGGVTHRFVVDFRETDSPQLGKTKAQLMDAARLLILQPVILGTVTRHVSKKSTRLNFAPSQLDSSRADFNYTLGPQMAPNEFMPYARLRRPNPDTATDEEFGRWLQLVMPNFTIGQWVSAEYSSWVPKKLDLLLKIPYQNFHPLSEALIRSIPESRKSAIIQKLEEYPELIDVIHARGWMEDARLPLLGLFEANKFTRPEHLCIIAGLNEPQTYDRLLKALEVNGNEHLYNVLRLKSGIEPRLSDAVDHLLAKLITPDALPTRNATHDDWQRLTDFGVPLMHGREQAKRSALLLFQWFKVKDQNGLSEFMGRHFQLPAGIKSQPKDAIDHFMNLKPEDCAWDPLIRRWVSTKH